MKWYLKSTDLLRRWRKKCQDEKGFITTEVLLFIGIVVVISVAAWTFRDAITGLFGRGTAEVNEFIR